MWEKADVFPLWMVGREVCKGSVGFANMPKRSQAHKMEFRKGLFCVKYNWQSCRGNNVTYREVRRTENLGNNSATIQPLARQCNREKCTVVDNKIAVIVIIGTKRTKYKSISLIYTKYN